MSIKPPNRPLQDRLKTLEILAAHGVTDLVALLGMRGYYRDSLGIPGVNDRGIYDDAIFLVSPSAYAAFNANTDPSMRRRGVAVLKVGSWRYKPGSHTPPSTRKSYPALRQAGPVIVIRDQVGERTKTQDINIHKGGYRTTSSLGCQTIFPDYWQGFIGLTYAELNRYGQATIPYLLIEQQG